MQGLQVKQVGEYGGSLSDYFSFFPVIDYRLFYGFS
jgi:hypothetical protein